MSPFSACESQCDAAVQRSWACCNRQAALRSLPCANSVIQGRHPVLHTLLGKCSQPISQAARGLMRAICSSLLLRAQTNVQWQHAGMTGASEIHHLEKSRHSMPQRPLHLPCRPLHRRISKWLAGQDLHSHGPRHCKHAPRLQHNVQPRIAIVMLGQPMLPPRRSASSLASERSTATLSLHGRKPRPCAPVFAEPRSQLIFR